MDFNPVLNPVFEWEYGYYAACRYLRYLNNAQRHDSVLCSFTWFQCSFELPGARVSFQVLYASQLTVLEQKKTIKKRIKLTYLCCKIRHLVVLPQETTAHTYWAKDTSQMYWWSFCSLQVCGAMVGLTQYMHQYCGVAPETDNIVWSLKKGSNLGWFTSMSDMFAYAKVFNQDISLWNTSQVTPHCTCITSHIILF